MVSRNKALNELAKLELVKKSFNLVKITDFHTVEEKDLHGIVVILCNRLKEAYETIIEKS